jgi:alanyl-tRNA synthetase
MTQKLYWEDAYATEFTAKIESIEKEGLVLNKTLFFPLSGNQASDKGILIHQNGQSTVDSVSISKGNIFHQVSSEFKDKVKIGDEINGKIDWEYRYGIMRAHTSQHILSAIILENYNVKTSRANIEFEEVSIQLDQAVSDVQFRDALVKLNEICTIKNKEITAEIYQEECLANLTEKIRSEIPDKNDIRLIRINNLDLVCCGGTHLKQSIEVGPVIIYEFKKGLDIRYYVGSKAIGALSKLNTEMLDLSSILNTPLIKLTKKIQNSLIELNKSKEFIETLLEQNLLLTSKTPIITFKDYNIYNINYQIETKIIKRIIDKFPTNSLILAMLGENRVQVVSNSENISANSIIQKLIKKFGGKGGGSNFIAQSSLDNIPTELISEVRQIISEI